MGPRRRGCAPGAGIKGRKVELGSGDRSPGALEGVLNLGCPGPAFLLLLCSLLLRPWGTPETPP